jgi:hypothetical protein
LDGCALQMGIRVERQLIVELLAVTPVPTNKHSKAAGVEPGESRLRHVAQKIRRPSSQRPSASEQLLVRMQLACWMAALHPRLGEDSLAVACGTDVVCAVAAAVEQNPRTWIRLEGSRRHFSHLTDRHCHRLSFLRFLHFALNFAIIFVS